MRDLYELLRDPDAAERMSLYGLNPQIIEEWEMGRMGTASDPTADEAIWNADRDLARRKANR